jgi:murein DD-endopeptidase MepM/ murein hydrolase activator NlpD
MNPGPSLADFAIRPEEARPFSPRSPPATHRVQAGDTVATVSARYQAPVRALIQANNLRAPFALTPGQELTIPRPLMHRVRSGETLLAVARTYHVDARSLALLNDLRAPYPVAPGDTLVLPAGARPRAPETPPDVAGHGPAAAGRFIWPLEGAVVGRFGAIGNGRRRDGLDITAPAGTPFRAAAAGRVVYAGDDLPGYGGLVLLQHRDGWVTAYAQAGRLLVREGDAVTQGQALGTLGPGRAAAQAGLHFQVRRGRDARDPIQYLPPR